MERQETSKTSKRVELIADPAWSGNDYFLFSSRNGKAPVSGFSKAKLRLDQEIARTMRQDRTTLAASPGWIADAFWNPGPSETAVILNGPQGWTQHFPAIAKNCNPS
jgi:hypothetical protein